MSGRTQDKPGPLPQAPNPDGRGWGMGEVLTLAAPAALSMVNVTIMQFVDGVMVARLIGTTAFGATFIAGILSFVPLSLAMGICSVVNTFVAQNYGARRRRRCSQYAWSGLYLGLLFAVAMLPLVVFGRWIFENVAALIVRLGGEPTSALELGYQTVYFRILVVGAGLRLVTGVIERYFYGIHRPAVVYGVSAAALVANIAGNYVLITGWWIFPKLGLAGAALGTVLAWGAAAGLMLAAFLSRREHAEFSTRHTWRPKPALCRNILRVGFPAGVQFCNDIFSWSVFNVFLVGHFGKVHRAASAAAVRYLHVSFMPAVGVGIACAALVGRYIGAGRPDLARRRAHAALLLALTYMGLCGLAFFAFRVPLIQVFAKVGGSAETSAAELAEIVRIGAWVLVCAAVFQCFDAISITFVGALRGAGDTLWPMLMTFALSWVVMFGGGVAMVRLAPALTSIGPWIAASAYVIILGLVMTWRFESGAWRKIDLLGPAPAAAPLPAGPVPVVGLPGADRQAGALPDAGGQGGAEREPFRHPREQ